MASNDWQPVVRVGEPRFIAGVGSRIKVEVKTRGWLSRDWRCYFGSQVSQQQLDARYSSYPCWDEVQRIEGSCSENEAERYIEMIDAAIHYANIKLRSNATPRTVLQGRASISRRVRCVSVKPNSTSWPRSWRNRSPSLPHVRPGPRAQWPGRSCICAGHSGNWTKSPRGCR